MKSSRSTNKRHNWADGYTRQARSAGWRSRAAFKLVEMDEKYQLFRPGDKVLDLGAAPGAWSQVAQQRAGKDGLVVSIDRQAIAALPPGSGSARHLCLQEDLLGRAQLSQWICQQVSDWTASFEAFDLVISDLAPALSGDRNSDLAAQEELIDAALNIARDTLRRQTTKRPRVQFVCKIFLGSQWEEVAKRIQTDFIQMRVFKPKASRAQSRECYVLGWGLKAQNETNHIACDNSHF